jgi:hypothetical protein
MAALARARPLFHSTRSRGGSTSRTRTHGSDWRRDLGPESAWTSWLSSMGGASPWSSSTSSATSPSRLKTRYLIFRSRARRTCGATTSSKTSHGSSYCEPKTPQTMASPSRLQTTRTTGRAETVNGWPTRRSGSARVALSRGLFNGPPTQAPAPCADRVGHRASRQVRDRMARLQRRQRRALRNVSLFGCRRVIGWVRGPAAATANAGPARAVPRGRLLV